MQHGVSPLSHQASAAFHMENQTNNKANKKIYLKYIQMQTNSSLLKKSHTGVKKEKITNVCDAVMKKKKKRINSLNSSK